MSLGQLKDVEDPLSPITYACRSPAHVYLGFRVLHLQPLTPDNREKTLNAGVVSGGRAQVQHGAGAVRPELGGPRPGRQQRHPGARAPRHAAPGVPDPARPAPHPQVPHGARPRGLPNPFTPPRSILLLFSRLLSPLLRRCTLFQGLQNTAETARHTPLIPHRIHERCVFIFAELLHVH